MAKRGKTIAHNHVHNRHNKPKVKYSVYDKPDMWWGLFWFVVILLTIAHFIFNQ